MKKNILSFIGILALLPILIIWFQGCKKTEVIYDSPSIEIKSITVLGLTTFQVVTEIIQGEGQELINAEIALIDITITSAADIVQKIVLKGEPRQIDTLILFTDRLNHDFSVRAILKTNHYTYESLNSIVRMPKNQITVSVPGYSVYQDASGIISNYVNRGDQIFIRVNSTRTLSSNDVKVKLNRSIILDHSYFFSSHSYSTDGVSSGGLATIPEDISSGDYEVFLYIDGVEFKAEKKIKVLKGEWQIIDPNYPGEKQGDYAWFLKNDCLYLMGGSKYATTITHQPIWKYNLRTGDWEHRNDFPSSGKIYPFNLEHNQEAIIIVQNESNIEVWKYNESLDNWSLLTIFPGMADYEVSSFIIDDKLFIGGGQIYINNEVKAITELWAFDFSTHQWERKNDIPWKFYVSYISATTSYEVFMFSLYTNKLLQYYPSSDEWEVKKSFPGQKRETSRIVVSNNKLYLIAGTYSSIYTSFIGMKDCWEYSIESDTWDVVAFLPDYFSDGIVFAYNNKIFAGLGYVMYSSYDKPLFYQLDL